MSAKPLVDCHAHAFPDFLAAKALEVLTDKAAGCVPYADGTVNGLLSSMDRAGIDAAVVANIATHPKQVRPILDWSKQIASARIRPFVSVHPGSDDNLAVLEEAAGAGIQGVKIHGLYQDFAVDDDRMWPIYDAIASLGLVLLFHAGNDPAYTDCEGSSPARLRRVHDRVPELRMITAHLGGWRVWDAVERCLAGTGVYIECSYTIDQIEPDLWQRIFDRHDKDRLLFGTDSPWADQHAYLERFRALPIDTGLQERILRDNPCALLGIA